MIIFLAFWTVLLYASQAQNPLVDLKPEKEIQHGITSTPGAPSESPCLSGTTCVVPVQCPAHVRDGITTHCHVTRGRFGICCTTGQNHTALNHKVRSTLITRVSKDILKSAAQSSRAEVEGMLQRESRLLTRRSSTTVPVGSASYTHFRNSKFNDPVEMSKVVRMANQALEMVSASRTIKKRERFSNEQYELGLIDWNLPESPMAAACVPPPMCPHPPGRYHTLDGTCNNPIHEGWGAAFTPYTSLLPPSYDDGVWTPRVSKANGQPLPSPRLISNALVYDIDNPDREHTLLLMTFGQFLSHDFTRAMEIKYPNGTGISCCTPDQKEELPLDWQHYACMPIRVPPNDRFFKYYGVGCINFIRSILVPRDDCTLGYAQQMNKVSHFIDGSGIYGTDHMKLEELREYTGGRLRMFNDFGRDLLPLTQDRDDCLTMEHGSACFTAGDGRSNQMVTLTALHTLFAREHNRIAHRLMILNPYWTDEMLFLETRRIVVAELQHIVYSQWLPEIIGHSTMYEFGINVDIPGYSNEYDPYVNPAVTNEFATAAFRFGHSLVDGKMKVYGPNKMEEIIDIPDVMFSPTKMRKREFLDEILTTLTMDCIQQADTSFADALTKYMFRGGNPFGLDLVSFNIQRGRDHGVRCYNDYRELVGLPKYKSFNDFGPEIGRLLQSIYSSVDDVDLYVGGLLEPHVPGAIVSYTFRDIIAEQFHRFKKGNKYFYNLHPKINPGHFTPNQLKEIKKSSMARIICDNSDNILLVRQAINPFRKPGIPGNQIIDCESPYLPFVDLSYWKETR